MPNIPLKHRNIINEDSYYRTCARRGSDCDGRMTIEEAFCYAGKQVKEMWNYIPLCEYHHGLGKYLNNGGGLDKKINQEIALSRATIFEIKSNYPRLLWRKRKQMSNEESLST